LVGGRREEADQLASRIAVIDHGRVVAHGTADDLKARVGGQVLEVRLADLDRTGAILAELTGAGCPVDRDTRQASDRDRQPGRVGERSAQLSMPGRGLVITRMRSGRADRILRSDRSPLPRRSDR
jgi:ABC-2 type transport system ATP-binding protein